MSFINKIRDRLFGFSAPASYEPPVLPLKPKRQDLPDHRVDPKIETPPQDKKFPDKVMFVCSGNICRSPYAEARFIQMCAEKHPQTRVISSGTLRINGREASAEMIAVAAERGLNLEPHRSKGISKLLIDSADVIFVMEEAHRAEVLKIVPNCGHKIVLLGNCLKTPKYDIEDPIGQSVEVYRAVTEEIDEALSRWWEQQENT